MERDDDEESMRLRRQQLERDMREQIIRSFNVPVHRPLAGRSEVSAYLASNDLYVSKKTFVDRQIKIMQNIQGKVVDFTVQPVVDMDVYHDIYNELYDFYFETHGRHRKNTTAFIMVTEFLNDWLQKEAFGKPLKPLGSFDLQEADMYTKNAIWIWLLSKRETALYAANKLKSIILVCQSLLDQMDRLVMQ